jgi:hypothetical protein
MVVKANVTAEQATAHFWFLMASASDPSYLFFYVVKGYSEIE